MQIICLGDSITDCNHLFEDFPLGNGYVPVSYTHLDVYKRHVHRRHFLFCAFAPLTISVISCVMAA